MSDVSSFGKELRKVRKLKGQTINELSLNSGVSSSYISQIENGKRDTPQPDLIKKLANGLSIDYYSLMRIAGYMKNEELDMVTLDVIVPEIPFKIKEEYLGIESKKSSRPSSHLSNAEDSTNPSFDLMPDIEIPQTSEMKEMIDDSFKERLCKSGTAGDFLKVLRIFRGIEPQKMAELLSYDVKTYLVIEETLRRDSYYLHENRKKIGSILSVGDFSHWYDFVIKQYKLFRHFNLSENDIHYETVCFEVPTIQKKTGKNGIDYYETYSPEELKRNFYNLDYLLKQNNSDVLYKSKILTVKEIKKVITMLDVLLEDD
ncbi:hypothetical protein SporoP8_07115 [Sporosarcina ureae]|uniref:helix-turn-helix domain-containing protein n=1 Tax=Sporosarcina ureae TaxID=1571 RepID=UPI000A1618AC|nr:helix-turn-helix transcriptional regulator [Sporosarcina ureae]ARJ38658.1 hypothetical protein SporoP8_07115 [Sporosarcina ureae]